jgi:hypothetical protein
MKLSDKQQLLSYFKDKRNKELTVTCEITGMTFVISAPILHNVKGFCYSGLSPLANKEAALSLGECTYSEAHYDLAPSTLAGAFLSLSFHYKLRLDHLSAIEANMLISQLPLFQISRALSFLAALSSHQLKRIPRFSLDEGEPEALKNWLSDCQEALDITNYTTIEQPQPKLSASKSFIDSSIITETRKAARELLKLLKADSILPLRLSTIISMSIQKNNLAMISVELRKNIIAALTKLGTENCINLASIFAETGKNLTNQESIVSKLLDEPASHFSTISNAPSVKLSLAEIIAQKKAQSIQDKIEVVPNTLKLIAELNAEIEAEIEESVQQEESIEEEFLTDHDSEEAIMSASGISELDLEDDDFILEQQEQDDFEQATPDFAMIGEEE